MHAPLLLPALAQATKAAAQLERAQMLRAEVAEQEDSSWRAFEDLLAILREAGGCGWLGTVCLSAFHACLPACLLNLPAGLPAEPPICLLCLGGDC